MKVELTHQATQNILWTFCMFTNDHKDIMDIDFGATSKFLQIREFANTKSTNNDFKMCVWARGGISVYVCVLYP